MADKVDLDGAIEGADKAIKEAIAAKADLEKKRRRKISRL